MIDQASNLRGWRLNFNSSRLQVLLAAAASHGLARATGTTRRSHGHGSGGRWQTVAAAVWPQLMADSVTIGSQFQSPLYRKMF